MNSIALWPHFLRPEWGWALLGLPLLAWLLWRRQPSATAWRDVVDPHLLPALLDAGMPEGRSRRLLPWLLGYVLAVAALAGPSWQQGPALQWQTQAPLLVAVELSRGMLANDLPPNRLQRVRLKLAQLLDERQGGQVGLIAYAGEAFTVAPLTDDARTVRALLDALDPSLMPVDGRRADRAIAHAQALIGNAGYERGDILLLASGSDGAAATAAREAAAQGLRVSVIGIGTPEGAPARDPDGGFVSGDDGGLQLWRLESDALEALVAAGGGRYAKLRVDSGDLRAVAALHPRGEQRVAEEAGAQRWQDAGYWLIVPLLPLVLLAFRRGAFAAVLLVVALPRPAAAVDWASLWQRDDQRAHAALVAGEYERARELAEDPAIAAAAAYRLQDWETAVERWAQRDDARSHYNRGNALAQAGRHEDALAAYDEALRRDPELADAAANRDAVKQWLEQQPPQPGEGEQGPSQPGDQPSGEPPQSGESGDDQSAQQDEDSSGRSDPPPANEPGDSREAGSEAQHSGETGSASEADTEAAEAALREAMQRALEEEGEAADGAATESTDPAAEEQRRALEQWLRRVPDDPGGLLRRKFALEYQRRQLERDADR